MFTAVRALDQHIYQALSFYGNALEKYFECDVLAYIGPIHPAFLTNFLEIIEALQLKKTALEVAQAHPKRLAIVLTTPGGVVEATEKMVEITRQHYEEVYFVVPDAAMSAGTIWCMSGEKIYMDYASSLGPIDPQVELKDRTLVPALGYLDKVQEFIKKSNEGKLSNAEFLLLKNLDLAMLRRYEQAKDLSESLLKKWLVDYKFKTWLEHRTNNPGQIVTPQEKSDRADEIAKALSDNKLWHSHGRMIGIDTLRTVLRLEIEDYSTNTELRNNLRVYNGLLSEYLERQQVPVIVHNARL